MTGNLRSFRSRHASGFVTLGKLLLVLIVFGGYTGYKFLPVLSAKSRIQRAVESVVSGTKHRETDDYLRHNIARAASAASFPLEKEAIEISREKRPGERIFHVAIHHPLTVDYLGAERTYTDVVRLSHTVRVNEAAEARHAESTRRRAERQRMDEERMARRQREIDDAWEDCEFKHGKGNCEVYQVPGSSGSADRVIRNF